MEFLPLEECACYRAANPESGKLNPSGSASGAKSQRDGAVDRSRQDEAAVGGGLDRAPDGSSAGHRNRLDTSHVAGWPAPLACGGGRRSADRGPARWHEIVSATAAQAEIGPLRPPIAWLEVNGLAVTTESLDFMVLVDYVGYLRVRPKVSGVWRGSPDVLGRSLRHAPVQTLSANSINAYVREGFDNPGHAARRYSWIRPPSTSLRSTVVRVAPGTWGGRMPAGTARPRPRCGLSST
jgi:hypothetical protein